MPPTAVARLPKVPMPLDTTAVSPWITLISSSATPSWSADDLRERCLLPLAVRRRAGEDRNFSAGLQLHFAIFPEARSHGADLDVGRKPDAQIASAASELFLLATQLFIAGKLERFAER